MLGVLAGIVAAAGTLAVTAAGFALSFDAIRAVGRAAHIRHDLAWMLPITVDGAMSVAAVCALVLRKMRRSTWYPWVVVLVGSGIAVAANALHAYQAGGTRPLPPEWAMAVSAVPPLLLALSVHLLVILAEAVRGAEVPVGDFANPGNIPHPGTQVQASTRVVSNERLLPEVPSDPVPDGAGISSPPEQLLRPSGTQPSTRQVPGRTSARDRVTEAVRTAPNATVTELSKLAGVTPKTVRRHLNGVDVAGGTQ